MHDYTGDRVKSAEPGDPVEVLGFDGVPDAGEFVPRRRERPHAPASWPASAPTASRPRCWPAAPAARCPSRTSSSAPRSGEVKELDLVLKADVSGSLEAFEDEIAKLPQDEVVGQRHPHAASAASTSPTSCWPPRPTRSSSASTSARSATPRQAAEREGVEIRTYSVIYQRDRRAARRDGGHARARGGRGDHRHRRGPPDVPRLARRHDRRLLRHRRHRPPRREGARRPRRHGHLRHDDRLAASASTTTSARSRPASSAASCSPTSRTSRRATSWRSTRPAGRARAQLAVRQCRRTSPCC